MEGNAVAAMYTASLTQLLRKRTTDWALLLSFFLLMTYESSRLVAILDDIWLSGMHLWIHRMRETGGYVGSSASIVSGGI